MLLENRNAVISSVGSDFNYDMGVTTDEGETFGLSVFLRDGNRVFRTYFTSGRGVEALGSVWTFLDLTRLGRQEDWEDSPEGYPQTRRMSGGASLMNTRTPPERQRNTREEDESVREETR